MRTTMRWWTAAAMLVLGTLVTSRGSIAPDVVPAPISLSPPHTGSGLDEALDTRTGRLFVVSGRTVDDNTDVGVVSTVDVASGAIVRQVIVPSFWSGEDMALDEASARVFVVSAPDQGRARLSVVDARTGALLRTAALDSNPVALAIAPTAARVVVVAAGDGTQGTVRLFDARTGTALPVHSVAADPASVTVDDADGRVFVVSGAGGLAYAVSTIEARSGRVLRAIVVGPRPSSDATASTAPPGPVAVDTRRGHVFVAAGLPNGVSGVAMLDARTGALLRTVPLGITPHGIALDEQRGRVFVEGGAGTQRAAVDTLDARSGALIRSVDIGVAAVGGQATLVVDGARGRVFVGVVDQIALLDATSGAVRRALPTHDTPIDAGSLVVDGPTGHLFVYGTNGDTAAARVFDVVTGRALSTATFPRGAPTQVSALDTRRARAIVLVVGSLGYGTTPESPGSASIPGHARRSRVAGRARRALPRQGGGRPIQRCRLRDRPERRYCDVARAACHSDA